MNNSRKENIATRTYWTFLAPICDRRARDANILHDENWALGQAELPIETLFRHKEVICGLQLKLVSRRCSKMHDQDGIAVHCDGNVHVNTTRRKEKSPGAGGQLDQGSRPAVALRFHAAVARDAVRG